MKKTKSLLLVFMVSSLNALCMPFETQTPDSLAIDSITYWQMRQTPLSQSEGDEPYINRFIPPSPNAAAFARYGETPVSYTTGVPDISIPIYTIELDGFSLPITLSYHASGIRLEDVATPVGLGWVLNSGGIISRTIEGRADLKAFSLTSYGPTMTDTIYMRPATLNALVDSVEFGNEPVNGDLLDLMTGGSQAQHDLCSDRYSFNFGDKSGIMRYSFENDKFYPLNHYPLDVQYTLGEDIDFAISDANGIYYEFRDREYTGVADDENQTDVTSWHLSRVVTLKGDTIQYEYDMSPQFSTYSLYTTLKLGHWAECDFAEQRYEYIEDGHFYSPLPTRYRHEPLLVKSIRWKGNVIRLSYADDTKDISPKRLSRVDVISMAGDTVKSVVFTHEWRGLQYGDYRRMLKEVDISGEGKYSFTYNTSQRMPHYTGYSGVAGPHKIDYWGYFNGKATHLIPRETILQGASALNLHDSQSYAAQYGGDRTPDLNCTLLYSLNRISYPTGGYTSLSYELNDLGIGGLRVKSVSDHCNEGGPTVTKTYTYGNPLVNQNLNDRFGYTGTHFATDLLFPSRFEVFDEFTCSSSPMLPLSIESGSNIFYGFVRETYGDGCYTNYEFDYGVLRNVRGLDVWRHPSVSEYETYDEGSTLPLLSSKKVYDQSGTLNFEERYEYQIDSIRSFVAGNRIASLANVDAPNPYPTLPPKSVLSSYDVICKAKVMATAKTALLKKKVVTDHIAGTTIQTAFTYADLNKTLQPKSVTVNNGDGKNVRTVNSFVYERTDAVSREMVNNYFTTDIVTGTTTYRSNQMAERSAVYYKKTSHGFVVSRIKGSVGSASLEDKVYIDRFDSYGNPIRIIENSCDTALIEWGYNGMYPIRIEIGGLASAYTWKPLFGVSSVTKPSGYTVNYTYEKGPRLIQIRDARGKIEDIEYGTASVTSKLYTSSSAYQTSVQYYDGLGRPFQSVTPGVSSGKYLLVHTDYDNRGREKRKWLPIERTSRSYVQSTQIPSLASNLYGTGETPYSEISYDAMGRDVFVSTPGQDWAALGKGKAKELMTNAANSVKLYNAPTSEVSMTKDGFWPMNTLACTLTTDEDGLLLYTFTDKEGRKILERRGSDNDTYFVYNNLGQLRYVLSPQYQKSGFKAEFGYEYRYDNKGRIVKKILPACAAERYWYTDGSSRIAYSQDGALAENGRYRYYIYDRAGRLTEQGTCTSTDGSYPDKRVETSNFYDSYDFIGMLPSGISVDNSFVSNHIVPVGLPSGRMQVLSNGERLYEIYCYDAYERMTKSQRIYPDNNKATNTLTYNYYDKITSSNITHSPTGLQFITNSSYLNYNGLLSTATLQEKYGSRQYSVRQIQNVGYDALKRPSTIKYGITADTIRYGYDLNSHITSIKAKAFDSRLNYTSGPAAPRYNGFVSSFKWKSPGDTQYRVYAYDYDNLGRFKSAIYGEGENMDTHANRYNEEILLYSENSMPRRLQRRGLKQNGKYGKIDNLHITLDGNRIKSIKDDAAPILRTGAMDFVDGADNETEYDYDVCGRLIRDDNKGIELIKYDDMGYPREIYFKGGNRTRYVYTPDGEKLRTVHLTALTPVSVPLAPAASYAADSTEYLGGLILHNGVPERYLFDNGYLTFSGAEYTPTYHYFTKDHHGNVRAMVNQSGAIEQYTHYYPLGGIISDASSGQNVQPYKYNAKELDRMHGLDWYDFGFRSYDAFIDSWTSMDPLCEKYYNTSPYSFCAGNPVDYRDINGLNWIMANYNGDEFYYFDEKIKSQEDIYTKYKLNKKETSIRYIGENLTLERNGQKFELNSDGSITIAGKTTKTVYDSNSLHIGSSDQVEFSASKNYYGVYLGDKNPQYKDADYYALPPINELDYAAYQHDRGYDTVNAKGISGALSNLDTLKYDRKLVKDCTRITKEKGITAYHGWAFATAIIFFKICDSKEKTILRLKSSSFDPSYY